MLCILVNFMHVLILHPLPSCILNSAGPVFAVYRAQNDYNKMTRKVWAYKAVQSQGNQIINFMMMLFTYFGLKRFYLGKFGQKNSIKRNPIMITHF